MPTYDYVCDACGHNFEEFQSITEDPLSKCPECKKKKLRRLFGTGAAVLFKGSGFYETDYRSESYKSAAKKEQEATSSTDSKNSNGTTGSSDTKTTPKETSTSQESGKSSKSSES